MSLSDFNCSVGYNSLEGLLESFLDLLGSMGLETPDDLTPAHVIRRVAHNQVQPLSEVHTYLEPGQLLGRKIPDNYRKYWDGAHADRF